MSGRSLCLDGVMYGGVLSEGVLSGGGFVPPSTTDYLLVDISLSGMLSVVMVNDYSDFQHNYFSLT